LEKIDQRRQLENIVGGKSNINAEYQLELDFANIKHLTFK